MNARAQAIIDDILTNHLPRVIEGLKLGYVDENQILVIYDHAVRARIINEQTAQPEVNPRKVDADLYESNQWLRNAERILHREGWERCTSPACNCSSYHKMAQPTAQPEGGAK